MLALAVATLAVGGSEPWLVPLAGVISGASQVLAEQPLDTLKTRLQSVRYDAAAGPLQLARTTLQLEGAGALFRGVVPRLLTYPLVKLSLFSLYEFFYAKTHSTAIAGACAGMLNTAVACPADVIKSLLQVAPLDRGVVAPVRLTRDLVRAQGLRSLYRGLLPLIARDSLGYALLYTVYFHGTRSAELGALPKWVLGGLAGTAFYAATLPIDRIKVIMQTAPVGQPRSLRVCVEELRRQGPRAFYRGAGPTLARTFVGQAVALTAYDLLVSRG